MHHFRYRERHGGWLEGETRVDVSPEGKLTGAGLNGFRGGWSVRILDWGRRDGIEL